MTVPAKVYELIEKFDRNREAYLSNYNETQVRGDFIDPLLEALGWDVHNRHGYPEAYRQVIEEDKLKIGGGTKAPDYGFYVGGARKFFLEAKQPSVDIAGDVAPAVQLRRYAWSAQLPLSIVSDFEEFAFYDCRFEPQKTDKPSTARLDLLTYDKYVDRWDQIYSVFSYEAVRDGSLDKFAETTKRKRGTQTVDDAFLKEMEGWREALAHGLASDNNLSQRQLNYAIQMTIDRIIFLRMAEDRGIEDYGRLLGVTDSANVYGQLCDLFREADDRYNSGLFHFRREKGRSEDLDRFTLGLQIDDALLRRVIGGLYYPESPYEFGVLPEDVLGQVYERFLGKLIRLESGGNRAVVEEKPEVRKAGGVYYTPTYIVDYIVEHTVGKLLEKKTPEQALKLKIVDPARGSGSFLLGAYKYLLDWYCDRYLEDGSKKSLKKLYQGAGGRWMLTIDEKKRILLSNIYGVDIDPQAVEVTKLSLLLKVLEGESEQTLETQLKMFHERALPDLDNNIKSGNSLIGPDFYEDEQMMFLDEEECHRINVFDWRSEFPRVFTDDNPGFDAVIGNPPYIRIHNLINFYPNEVRYVQNRFVSAGFGKVDIYVAFVERGLELLNKRGLLGFIVPNKFMQADYGRDLGALIADQKALLQIIDFVHAQVFEKATTYTCLLFLSGFPNDSFAGSFNTLGERPSDFLFDLPFEEHSASALSGSAWALTASLETTLLRKIEDGGEPLTTFVDLAITGVKTGANKVFVFEQIASEGSVLRVRLEGQDHTVELEAALLCPYWKAGAMKRYTNRPGSRLLLYPYVLQNGKTALIPDDVLKNSYPKTWAYLNTHKATLESRQKGKLKGPNWYGLSFASDLRMFSSPKMVTPTLATTNSFSFDEDGHFFPQGAGGGCGIVTRDERLTAYLLGILNSKLLTFYFHRISSRFQGGYFAYEPRYLRRIPIRPIDFSDPEDVARHDRMVGLVERMLALHERLAAARISQEKTIIQRQVEAADRQIDRLVYELYGLTEEEIKIVEGA